MKSTTLPVLAGLAFLSVSCGEKHPANAAKQPDNATIVLAEKHYLPAAGTVATKDTTMVMADAAMKVKAGPQELEGSATQTESGRETLEILSRDKVRRLLVSKKAGGEITINGKVQPTPKKADPLEGLPVILERSGETWTASLESGAKPGPEQQSRVNKMAKDAGRDSDFQMYGDTPRKPGDKWDVDPSKLLSFGEAEDVTGTYRVEFVEVKDFQGVRCALLKATFDFKGKTESKGDKAPMDMEMKGEAISHRSIADMIDLDVEINGTMTISGSPAANVTMHVEGPTKITEKISLKRP